MAQASKYFTPILHNIARFGNHMPPLIAVCTFLNSVSTKTVAAGGMNGNFQTSYIFHVNAVISCF